MPLLEPVTVPASLYEGLHCAVLSFSMLCSAILSFDGFYKPSYRQASEFNLVPYRLVSGVHVLSCTVLI